MFHKNAIGLSSSQGMIVLMLVESKVHGESQKCKFTSVASFTAQH